MEFEREAEAVKIAKEKGLNYQSEQQLTGERPKQLLARSRYILYKNTHKWSPNQRIRSFVLYDRYPHLKAAYEHGQAFLSIYRHKCKLKAQQVFEAWINLTYEQKIEDFYGCTQSLQAHKETILNYFHNRATNASAESFNAKIKGFSPQLADSKRGELSNLLPLSSHKIIHLK